MIEQNSFPIFDEDWGADEELLLIEGCETYGIGSWADIADHIGGYRTKDEVRDHYLKIYVDSSKFPLPERCSKDNKELSTRISREEFQAQKKRRIQERKHEAKNAPVLQPKTKPTASVPSCHEIQGYMPGRLEFETEYANEAEEAVQLMQFDPGDGINSRTGELEPEMELKLTVMDIYNARLTQRVERKKVIFEHNLLDYRENMKVEKRRTKEEKDLVNRAKPFARMMNRRDFESFTQGLVDELNLRQAIAQLQEWRKMRISDLRSGERYEAEKAMRIQKNVPMGSMDRERLAANQRSKASQQLEPPSGAALLVAPELPPQFQPGAPDPVMEPKRQQHQHQHYHHTNGLTNGIVTNGTPSGAYSVTINGANGTNGAGGASGLGPAKPTYNAQPISGVPPLVLTPENAPDLHLLTTEERKLCEVCRIQPKPYLMIKEQVIKTATASGGQLKKKQVKEICRLETQKGVRIYDFFVHAGWIGKA